MVAMDADAPRVDAVSTGIFFDPLSDAHTADPYPYYRVLRDHDPAHRSEPNDLWVISRYEDVRTGLDHPQTLSSKTAAHGDGGLCPAAAAMMAGHEPVPTLLTLDPPEHGNNRRPFQRALSVKRSRAMEPHIEEFAVELLSGFKEARHVEFISGYAAPLPLSVIAELLGIPRSDHAQFRFWGDCLKAGHSRGHSEQEQIEIATGMIEAEEYLLNLIRERRADPRDDFITEMVNMVRVDGRTFDDSEVLSLSLQLALAGHETTTSTLGGMMLILATHPGMAERLREEPGGIGPFVEESLRYFSPVQGRYRRAVADTQLHGKTIKQGDQVMLSLASANRDESLFDQPDVFDPGRENNRQHVSFGYGRHFCVGSEVARAELRISLRLLTNAMTNVRLAESENPLGWARHFHLRGLDQLKIEFDPIEP
jgi:cytochrome P450